MWLRVKLPDGTSWPDAQHLADLGWRLRYGTITESDRLSAAEAISTLLHLYEVPSAAKHLPAIRALAQKARGA